MRIHLFSRPNAEIYVHALWYVGFEGKMGALLVSDRRKKRFRRVQRVLNAPRSTFECPWSSRLAQEEFFPKKNNFSCSPLYPVVAMWPYYM